MSSAVDVAKAQADAAAARADLMHTAGELQERLAPRTLVREGKDKLRALRRDVTDDAVDAVRARPGLAAGVAAAVAVLLLHRPLIRLSRRLFSRRRATDETAPRTRQDRTETNP